MSTPIRQLPVIETLGDIIPALQKWRKGISPLLARPNRLKSPWRWRITNKRNGLLLEWASLKEADGYEILRSDTQDFSSPLIIPINSGEQNSYFDAIGGESQIKFYKIRATSGSIQVPRTVKGILSGMIFATSIAADDTSTPESTGFDPSVDDEWQLAQRGQQLP